MSVCVVICVLSMPHHVVCYIRVKGGRIGSKGETGSAGDAVMVIQYHCKHGGISIVSRWNWFHFETENLK